MGEREKPQGATAASCLCNVTSTWRSLLFSSSRSRRVQRTPKGRHETSTRPSAGRDQGAGAGAGDHEDTAARRVLVGVTAVWVRAAGRVYTAGVSSRWTSWFSSRVTHWGLLMIFSEQAAWMVLFTRSPYPVPFITDPVLPSSPQQASPFLGRFSEGQEQTRCHYAAFHLAPQHLESGVTLPLWKGGGPAAEGRGARASNTLSLPLCTPSAPPPATRCPGPRHSGEAALRSWTPKRGPTQSLSQERGLEKILEGQVPSSYANGLSPGPGPPDSPPAARPQPVGPRWQPWGLLRLHFGSALPQAQAFTSAVFWLLVQLEESLSCILRVPPGLTRSRCSVCALCASFPSQARAEKTRQWRQRSCWHLPAGALSLPLLFSFICLRESRGTERS